jgi:hypothetical protein
MYLKKEIYDIIIRDYTNKAYDMIYEINRNKEEIKRLAKRQATLKKTRRELFGFIRQLKEKATGGK